MNKLTPNFNIETIKTCKGIIAHSSGSIINKSTPNVITPLHNQINN